MISRPLGAAVLLGLPGAGKTILAEGLTQRFGARLVSRDEIRCGLLHTRGLELDAGIKHLRTAQERLRFRSGCLSARGVDRQPILSVMSVRFIFRCQFCDAQPDPMTQISLEKAMRENTWGAYQNALPGRWLVFHGRGLYGSPRYACAEHRGDLVAHLREHFGTIGFHVWKRPPYPSSLAHADTDNAWFAATRRQGGWGS